ncbi:HAD-IA family hydrolase [Oceaniserpentilla sp. 4NH20-0058]|uniref:HAD family hydrolase n=1 Tax=Oceaniserpentilla sp. 4NH20-0058 TaxID=3127660 RepID=UPI003109955F
MTSPVYNGVLFDLDGTLIDTADDFVMCLNDLRNEAGLAALPDNEIRKVVSDGARAMIKLCFNLAETDPGFNELRHKFLDLYLNNIARKSRLFSGLENTLTWCESQQIPWGIVTNKGRVYSEALLKALKLDTKIATLVCPDDVTNTKPHPEPILRACAEINLSPEQCVYVGDHARDIESGKRANMATIAAAYGYVHSEQEAKSWQADWYTNTPEELNTLLQSLLRQASGNDSPLPASN